MSAVVSAPALGVLTCVFWDVQHGHATYVGTPAGEHVAIDAGMGSVGTGGQAFSPLLWLRNRWGVERLDAAVITHPHRDHVADIANLELLRPPTLYRPRLERSTVVAAQGASRMVDEYERWETTYNGPITHPDPVNCSRADGYVSTTFSPRRCPETNLNNRSMVTVISYAGTKIVIPGDNEGPSWLELLERPEFVSAIEGTDILLAAHHGREAGFCAELFEVIQPLLTVVSDGPSGGTSVTEKYASKTRGWVCGRRRGRDAVERRVLTTRKDGAIAIRCYVEGGRPYLDVTID